MQISDYHTHTLYSDGKNSMRTMIERAAALDLHQFGISDHSCNLKRSDGSITAFDMPKWNSYITEARTLQKEFPFLRVGLECEIDNDGTMDIPEFLKGGEKERFGLDYLIGSVHAYRFRGTRKELSELFTHIINEYPIDIIGHMFQPLLGIREGFFDEDESSYLIRTILSAKQEVSIEINSTPKPYRVSIENLERFGRYDIPFLKKCIDNGIRLTIGSDAHNVKHVARYPQDLTSALIDSYGSACFRTDIPKRT